MHAHGGCRRAPPPSGTAPRGTPAHSHQPRLTALHCTTLHNKHCIRHRTATPRHTNNGHRRSGRWTRRDCLMGHARPNTAILEGVPLVPHTRNGHYKEHGRAVGVGCVGWWPAHGTHVVLLAQLLRQVRGHDLVADVGRGSEVRLAGLPPRRRHIGADAGGGTATGSTGGARTGELQ
jgi:hypothetical protein